MKRSNKTKIVATLGPASADKSVMKRMVEEGVNVFRLNFSHGTHDDHRRSMQLIRELNDENHWNVATLADLQGPKLRIGTVEEGTVLEDGQKFTITTDEGPGNKVQAYLNYEQIARDVKAGERILIDDGKIILKVLTTNGLNKVETEVIQGGPLKSRKGVNLPNTRVSLPCLTPKDLEDLQVALQGGVEWIGLSFVRSANDVLELRQKIRDHGYSALIISKIEKPEAVMDFDEILSVTDGVMVARGDLGVEVPMQNVPLIQKEIVNKAHQASKPVIIATQMMESMIQNLSPTRAEVNDVANSVLDGADAMMLSGETSVGEHPVEVIKAMSMIIQQVESSGQIKVKTDHPPTVRNERYVTDSICYNASKIADQIGAKAILSMTFSGYTAFKISSHRPRTNILVFTANRSILNTLSLLWGVRGFFYDKMVSTDETFDDIKKMVIANGIVEKGDFMVKIASMPIKDKGMTNMLKIGIAE
ncbi:MAG: pyruvate kinase [Bacteroidota bacterium]|nr:pyruvate kinase [Bacteroidota bacterium]MDX5429189.1 pyruvate kinase [Bacteroidota bacterium]MDX5448960.1 pyruvate kinase [Bacteroidota bacterium]MDX5506823.1 pyruvate kinase [Bacteroidota bacterium]